MGKTRDLFKKIRDNKGTFQAKMGSINDRNGVDLKEAEDFKKRWQEYIEVTQSCPTFCDPMDYSPRGSSLHGILQARVLERVPISFSRDSMSSSH